MLGCDMSEDMLSKAAARGVRARDLLADDLLTEIFAGLERDYIAAWRTTKVDEEKAREKLFLAINVVAIVRDHLATMAVNGRLAERELRDLTEAAERQRRFGTLG